jgi:hypothetical protein
MPRKIPGKHQNSALSCGRPILTWVPTWVSTWECATAEPERVSHFVRDVSVDVGEVRDAPDQSQADSFVAGARTKT